jgi:exopolysaccharide biosynthesis polyprenyl glycosylphosphotransferase
VPVKSVRVYTLALILSDIFAILAAFTIAYVLRVQVDPRPLVTNIGAKDFITTFFLLTPFWLLIFAALDLYTPRVYQKRMKEIGKLLVGSFSGILLIIGFAFIVDFAIFPARLVAVYALILTFALLVLGREILRRTRSIAFRFGKGLQRVMIIGSGEVANNVIADLGNTPRSGFNIVAVCGSNIALKNTKKIKSLEKALDSLKELDIDTIIQTEFFEDESKNLRVFEAALTNHIGYSFVPAEIEFYSGNNIVDLLNGYPIISVSQTPLTGWGEVVKRIFDATASSLLLLLLSPVFLIVILLQKILNPGKIFYSHERVTKQAKIFKVYKFRSMKRLKGFENKLASEEFRAMGREDLALEYEKNFKVENDPRITPFGNFLRKSSLDELPQIWNVLKGDISLVGPRPMLATEISKKYSKQRGASLLSVRSGITGLWQVSGRSDITDEERIQLELYYVQNWSFWLDIKILLKTVVVVLKKTGAQ